MMEMEQLAVVRLISKFAINRVGDNEGIIILTDINECTRGTDNCDANAVCNNVAGGYTCSCHTGFHGNGVTCSGKQAS